MFENCCKYREDTLGSYLDGYVPEEFWAGLFDPNQTENVVKMGELVADAYYMARAKLKMSKEEAISLRSIILLGPVMEWAAEAAKGYKEALEKAGPMKNVVYEDKVDLSVLPGQYFVSPLCGEIEFLGGFRQCARVAPLPNGVPFSFNPIQVSLPR